LDNLTVAWALEWGFEKKACFPDRLTLDSRISPAKNPSDSSSPPGLMGSVHEKQTGLGLPRSALQSGGGYLLGGMGAVKRLIGEDWMEKNPSDFFEYQPPSLDLRFSPNFFPPKK
jgi:hypothetical protein